MNDKSKLIENCLQRVGRKITLSEEGNTVSWYAILTPNQRRNRAHFERNASPAGHYATDYYFYYGPACLDILALPEGTLLYCDNEAYCFVKKEPIIAGGFLQCHTGVLRKLTKGDSHVFN